MELSSSYCPVKIRCKGSLLFWFMVHIYTFTHAISRTIATAIVWTIAIAQVITRVNGPQEDEENVWIDDYFDIKV